MYKQKVLPIVYCTYYLKVCFHKFVFISMRKKPFQDRIVGILLENFKHFSMIRSSRLQYFFSSIG